MGCQQLRQEALDTTYIHPGRQQTFPHTCIALLLFSLVEVATSQQQNAVVKLEFNANIGSEGNVIADGGETHCTSFKY